MSPDRGAMAKNLSHATDDPGVDGPLAVSDESVADVVTLFSVVFATCNGLGDMESLQAASIHASVSVLKRESFMTASLEERFDDQYATHLYKWPGCATSHREHFPGQGRTERGSCKRQQGRKLFNHNILPHLWHAAASTYFPRVGTFLAKVREGPMG
jgi:hypothetical protein